MYGIDEQEIFGSAKVDAVTVTSKSIEGRARLAEAYHTFLGEAQSRELQEVWKQLGYTGWRSESVRYGSRKDSSILMATGDDAEALTEIMVLDMGMLDVRVTRVDVCLDIAFSENKRGWLKDLRYNGDFVAVHSAAGREISLVDSFSGETLYINKRTSGRFGRIYDKSSHYGLEQGWVYRFEIETKKDVARPVFDALFPVNGQGLLTFDGYQARVRGVLKTQFRRWGISLVQGDDKAINVRSVARINTVETQLEWLATSVRPVVAKLTRNGYRQAAFDALLGGNNERVI